MVKKDEELRVGVPDFLPSNFLGLKLEKIVVVACLVVVSIFLILTPTNPEEMRQFDGCIFFR